MPFIPHTETDIQAMLKTIGVDRLSTLFEEIPSSLLQSATLDGIPTGLSEMALTRLMRERAAQDGGLLCFIGAGAYEHFIPAAVWDIATRGEFMTAYTPYQAEASQGSLQLIYEYQTMMARLMALDVSNASLYDGASALAEAVLMAVRIANKSAKNSILFPNNIHPHYRQVVETIVKQQNIQLILVPYEPITGQIDQVALTTLYAEHKDNLAAFVIPQPNFFGVLEDVDLLTHFARDKNLLSIGLVNPLAMAWLKPPGEWAEQGVDIACGEGQPLGIPLASGGPYYGFLCCKKQFIRQMPGRIVGRTVDLEGKPGFVLTLQAREQHIRRAKATSNICTNQGLMVTASTIYMSLMGPERLRHTAKMCHAHTETMRQALLNTAGVSAVFTAPFFHEVVVRVNQPTEKVLAHMAKQGIQAGISLESYYPDLQNCLLLCATETKTQHDIHLLSQTMSETLGNKVTCPT